MINTNTRYEYGQNGETFAYSRNEQEAREMAQVLANTTGMRAFYRLENARNGCGWVYPENTN